MKSALTTLFIYTITFLLTLGGLLIAPFAYGIFRIRRMNRPEAVRMLIWLYGRMWVQAVSFIIPVELPEQATASPCVLVANHASFFDVYFIGAQSEWNLSMAVRDWPFKIGVYKPFMEAAEYVRTESGDPERTLEAAQTVLRKGGSILFSRKGLGPLMESSAASGQEPSSLQWRQASRSSLSAYQGHSTCCPEDMPSFLRPG